MKPSWELPETYRSKRNTEWEQMDAAYFGRWFEVVREVKLTGNQFWRNRFGRSGQHGWIIRDTETGEQQVVGRKLLQIIHYHYNAVALPWYPRPNRKDNRRAKQLAEAAEQRQADIELAVAKARAELDEE